MRLGTRGRAGRAIAAATVVGVIAAPLALTTGTAQATAKVPSPLKVMTRNLYLGADIQRPIAAIVGETNPELAILKLANATYETRAIVDQTDFGTRARLLAQEIAAAKPDLVGLQEVALWRSGELEVADPTLIAVPNAETVDFDFLKMLRRALRQEGSPYRAISVNTLSDVEAPSWPGQTPTVEARDIRLTMRDVILKRVGSGVKVLRHRERDYSTNFQIPPLAGKSLDFTRGYQWVDAKIRGKKFRFINTHLEAFSSNIAYAQMKEMLEGPASKARTTIIACDCNSDPLNQSVKTSIGDTLPHSEPYWLATGKHAYFDTWLQRKPARLGWTSGLNETVDEPANAEGWPVQNAGTENEKISWTHRIDLILARRADGRPLKVTRAQATGRKVDSRHLAGEDTGLWPSDHAGVVISLRRL